MGAAASFFASDKDAWPQNWFSEEEGAEAPNGANVNQHIPSERDVLDVKEALLRFLPLELIDTILDNAEYWPTLSFHSQNIPARSVAAASFPHHNASYCYYISPRLPETCRLDASLFKVRKVAFRIASHDQGWGGEPGLTGAYARLQSDNAPNATFSSFAKRC